MKRTDSLAFGLGCIFLSLGCGLVYLSYHGVQLTRRGKDNTYLLHASIENIGNIKPGAPVKIAGITIGRLLETKLEPSTLQPTLSLAIDNHYQLPKNSQLSIKSAGLLGEQYISITPGFLSEEGYLAPGEIIEDTHSPLDWEAMIGRFLYSTKSS